MQSWVGSAEGVWGRVVGQWLKVPSFYAKSNDKPATGALLHVKAICGIVAQFHALLLVSVTSHPKLLCEHVGRKFAGQPVRDLAGSAVTEDCEVVPLPRIFDCLGNRYE